MIVPDCLTKTKFLLAKHLGQKGNHDLQVFSLFYFIKQSACLSFESIYRLFSNKKNASTKETEFLLKLLVQVFVCNLLCLCLNCFIPASITPKPLPIPKPMNPLPDPTVPVCAIKKIQLLKEKALRS